MDGSYAEQPIFYSPMWGNGNMPLPAAAQEMQRLQHLPPQFIIEEYVAARMKFEEERNAMMKHIGDLQHEKRMQEIHVIRLNKEIASLKASREEERVYWQGMIAQSKAETATLKQELERGKKDWALYVAEINKILASVKETSEKALANAKTRQLVAKCKEESAAVVLAIEKERKLKMELEVANEKMKQEVDDWKEKFCAMQRKVAEMEFNYKKALLKSRPRLIDLHYFIVRRLTQASRPYANAFCFTLGLSMQFSSGDDKFQLTTAFRKWLERGSCVPRTWGALLSAIKGYFRCEDLPATWIDDITADLIYGGVAALSTQECFCMRCKEDFSKEYEGSDTEDDSGGDS